MILEFLLEFLAQFLVEGLGEVFADSLETRTGRRIASAVTGLAGGAVWGAILRDRGQEAIPLTIWFALLMAVLAAFAAVAVRGTGRDADDSFAGRVLPWRWPSGQWETFALMNGCVALGVAMGFDLLF